MIGLFVTLPIQDGKQDEFEGIFKKAQAAVKADEPNCLQYNLCRDPENATLYHVMETYADEEALAVHGKTDGVREAMQAMGGCLAGAPDIKKVNVVSTL